MEDQHRMLEFPPEVFARLEPELYFQRHIQEGLRPSLRTLEEFRPISVQHGPQVLPQCIGSSVLRVGDTTVVCGITAGTSQKPGAIYTNVEIMRGSRTGPPTLEEMTTSQRLFQLANKTDLIDKQNYHIVDELENVTQQQLNELSTQTQESDMDVDTQGDINEDKARNTSSRVIVGISHISLIAHIQVLSRSGPVLDASWNALVSALQSTKLPLVYIDPTSREVCIDDDASKIRPLKLGSAAKHFTSTFGIYENRYQLNETNSDGTPDTTKKQYILSDLEGTTEEKIVQTKISVTCSSQRDISGLSIRVSGSTKLSKETIRACLARAASQAKLLETKVDA